MNGNEDEITPQMLIEEAYLYSNGSLTPNFTPNDSERNPFEVVLFASLIYASKKLYNTLDEQTNYINGVIDTEFSNKLLNITPIYQVTKLLDYHFIQYKSEKKFFLSHIKYVILPIIKDIIDKNNRTITFGTPKKIYPEYEALSEIINLWITEKETKNIREMDIKTTNNEDSKIKTNLLKIWKDPVFSKIISFLFIALLSLIYNLIVSIFEKTNFKIVFIQFWTQKIDMWIFLILILLVIILPIIITYFKINRIKDFKYDTETLNLDKSFFEKIRKEILTQEMMLAPRHNAFSSNPFQHETLFNIFEILNEKDKSDFVFINPHLEKLKDGLINEIVHFQNIMTKYIFGAGEGIWLAIPSEWKFEQPERYSKAVHDIRNQEKIICEKYDLFITEGRRILRV